MKRILVVSLAVALVLLIGSGAYVYNMLGMVQGSALVDPETGNPIGNDPEVKKDVLNISEDAPSQKDTGVINILLFGIDSGKQDEPARSDSIIIASIDKNNKSIKLTSLMRDMYVPIPGRKDNRINTSYIFGGPTLAIKTVNSNFNMNIEDYITVDYFAMEAIVDEVGGIPIDIKQAEIRVINEYIDDLNKLSKSGSKAPHMTKSGLQTLSGREAVAYSRVRFVGRDDFERTERQRRVLNEVFKKGKTVGVIKIPDLVGKILPNVETSLTKTEIIELGIMILGFNKQEIEQFRIPADGHYKDEWVSSDMLVLKPDLVSNTKLLHEFIYETKE